MDNWSLKERNSCEPFRLVCFFIRVCGNIYEGEIEEIRKQCVYVDHLS